MSWLVVVPYLLIAALGAVALVRDFRASPKIPRPTTVVREPSRLAQWTAGRIAPGDFERRAA